MKKIFMAAGLALLPLAAQSAVMQVVVTGHVTRFDPGSQPDPFMPTATLGAAFALTYVYDTARGELSSNAFNAQDLLGGSDYDLDPVISANLAIGGSSTFLEGAFYGRVGIRPAGYFPVAPEGLMFYGAMDQTVIDGKTTTTQIVTYVQGPGGSGFAWPPNATTAYSEPAFGASHLRISTYVQRDCFESESWEACGFTSFDMQGDRISVSAYEAPAQVPLPATLPLLAGSFLFLRRKRR